jgi:hypothetical protein
VYSCCHPVSSCVLCKYMLKKLFLAGLLLIPLVHIHAVHAQNVPVPVVVKSIDAVYEIGIDAVITVTEKISFSQDNVGIDSRLRGNDTGGSGNDTGGSGEYVRTIPKRISNDKCQITNIKCQGSGHNVSYGVRDVKVYGEGSVEIRSKISENNNNVEVGFDISNLPKDKNFVTLKYKIERAIAEVEKKDNLNVRNNIEMLGSLLVLGGGTDEFQVKSVTVKIKSPDAVFATVECYAGNIENEQRMCLSEFDKNEGRVYSTGFLGEGKGMLVSFKMMKGGEVKAPGKGAQFFGGTWDYVRVNWMALAMGTAGLLLIVYVLRKVFYVRRIRN